MFDISERLCEYINEGDLWVICCIAQCFHQGHTDNWNTVTLIKILMLLCHPVKTQEALEIKNGYFQSWQCWWLTLREEIYIRVLKNCINYLWHSLIHILDSYLLNSEMPHNTLCRNNENESLITLFIPTYCILFYTDYCMASKQMIV